MRTIRKTIIIVGALISLVTFLSIVGAAFGEVEYNGEKYFCIIGEPWTEINTCVYIETDYTNSQTGLDLNNKGDNFGFTTGADLIKSYLETPSIQNSIIGWSLPDPNPIIPGSAGKNNELAEIRCATGELVHLAITWDGDVHTDLGPVDSPSIAPLVNSQNTEADLMSTPALAVEIPLSDRGMFPLGDLRGHQTLKICGRWITDTNSGEGWNELHPVTSLTIITPPTVDAGSDATINEGSAFSSSGSFTDPGSDTWTATVDYGDGSGVQSLALSDKTFSLNHVYADNGVYTVTVTVNDGNDGNLGEGSDTAIVTVNNVAPTVNAGPSATINEGSTFSSSGSFTDPGSDTWTATVDYGDGSGVQSLALSGKTFSLNHVYADNGAYKVTVAIKDDDLGEGSGTSTVTVNNVDPTVGPITGPIDPLSVGTSVTASATFTDPGTTDTHTAEWNWGDGTTSKGTVTEIPGYIEGSHTYTTAGIYTVTLTVTDDDGGADSAAYMYVVIYDPSDGFVTGGGWINSPEGAYAADPKLAGRANFGFVSKYQKGTQTPTGTTDFQFKVANLNFHSETYEWLVVAGASAKFKGTGTIDGLGDYGFMLTAIDGAINGGGDADMFRIIIWDKNDGDKVVYDNKQGASITGNEATELAGGSIIIHQ